MRSLPLFKSRSILVVNLPAHHWTWMALKLALDVPASYVGRSWSPSCLNGSGFTVTLNAREKLTPPATGRVRLRLCLDLACANLGLLFPRITACDGDGLRPHFTTDC